MLRCGHDEANTAKHMYEKRNFKTVKNLLLNSLPVPVNIKLCPLVEKKTDVYEIVYSKIYSLNI